MNDVATNSDPAPPPGAVLRPELSLKFFGVGGAGGHLVDYLCAAGFSDIEFCAVNADARALAASRAPRKFQLGAQITRGLGMGGDPELGLATAEKEAAALGPLCAGADIVFLAAGLGGGTGTGASPVLARIARETGALVLGFAILPFGFEGPRRQQQAQRGLQLLKAAADGVICIPNQKLCALVDEKTSAIETFRLGNELLAQGLRGLWRLLTRPGLIHVDFAHLAAVLRGRHSESSFAMAEAGGTNRAREVVEKLLRSPLLGDGQALAEADSVLISIAGGADLNMAEVDRVMEGIEQACVDAHLTLGMSVDPSLRDRLEVTLIASTRNPNSNLTANPAPNLNPNPTPNLNPDPPPPPPNPTSAEPSEENAVTAIVPRESPMGFPDTAPTHRPPPRFLPPPPSLSPEQTEQVMRQQAATNQRLRKALPRLRQGQLPLEIVSKGRFEKSEPTIHNGEDLDVPTFKRRGLVLN